ncbi:MAG: AAA domain-containing protein [Nitrospiraceae bacterium]|nr:AAA domain-containing protein [Nitrospiraceae bacterium]
MQFDANAHLAVNLALSTLDEGQTVDLAALLASLCQALHVGRIAPDMAQCLPTPAPRRWPTEEPPLAPAIRAAIERIERECGTVSGERLFLELASSQAGRELLEERGADPEQVAQWLKDVSDHVGVAIAPPPDSAQETVSANEDGNGDGPGEDWCDEIFDNCPSREHELHNEGNRLYGENEFEKAVECYSQALELNADLVETLFNRSLAHTRLTRYDEAIEDMNRVIELNPHLGEAQYTLGLIREYQFEYEKAVECYEKAIEMGYEKAQTQIEVARQKHETYRKGGNGGRNSEDERHEARRREFDALLALLRLWKDNDLFRGGSGTAKWRGSPERTRVIEFLRDYGWMRTETEAESRGCSGREREIRSVMTTLLKMTRSSCVLLGPAGSGKSSVVYEVAHRMQTGSPDLPETLRDCDIFELSSAFLQADTMYRGQYEERVRQLIQLLQLVPNIKLFVDETHAFFQSSMEYDGGSNFNRANQAFKMVMADGSVSVIGCSTWAEYRRFIETDLALARRLDVIRIEPLGRDMTASVLRERKAGFERHYGLRIDNALVDRAYALTEEYLPGRPQPDISIQLLDTACALARYAGPKLTGAALNEAIENIIGRPVMTAEGLTRDDVFERLRRYVVGQDKALTAIADTVAAALGPWNHRRGPRGVLVFAGPTGVGKTETAVRLAETLGGDREALIRIDCNALQGTAYDAELAVHRLLGSPRGTRGYIDGQGGLLSRVRDLPECLVLFDEFEKANPAVGKLLLQIMDDGRIEDTDGNLLDFRRAFLVFATTAGAAYQNRTGLRPNSADRTKQPAVEESELRKTFDRMGLGKEFIGRIEQIFLFDGLTEGTIAAIIEGQLEEMARHAKARKVTLLWDEDVPRRLATHWQPQYGARDAASLLRRHVTVPLNQAQTAGELDGITRIRLRLRKKTGNTTATRRTKRTFTLFVE